MEENTPAVPPDEGGAGGSFSAFVRRRRVLLIGGALVVLLVAAGAGVLWYLKRTPLEQASFTLQASIADAAGVEPETTFLLSSDSDLSRKAVEGAIRLIPETAFTVSERSPREFEVTPKSPLNPDAVYQVMVAQGEIAERDYSWAFQVKATFRILATLPRDQGTRVPLNSGIEITFNREGLENYEGQVRLEPEAAGRFELHRNTLVFVSAQPLRPETVYTATVGKGIRVAGSDDALSEDYVFRFETSGSEQAGRRQPTLNFARQFWEVRPSQQPAFEVYAYQLAAGTPVNVTVYRLPSARAYTDAYLATIDTEYPWANFQSREFQQPEKAEVLLQTSVPVEEELDVRFLRLAEPLERGWYVADASVSGRRSQAWFQVTDIASYVSISGTKTLFWIKDLASGNAVRGAEIAYGGRQLGATEAEGVALVLTPDALVRGDSDNNEVIVPFFTARAGEEDIVIPVESEYGSVSPVWPSDEWWEYLSFDKTIYLPTDTLRFWGILKSRNGEDVRGQRLRVQLRDRGGYGFFGFRYEDDLTVYAETEAPVSEYWTITGELSFEALRAGTYDLALLLNGEEIATEYIDVEPYVKPAYKLSLDPNRRAVFAGESVVFSASGAFFDGTPASGVKLRYNGFGTQGEVVLDEEGKASMTVPTRYETGRYLRYPRYLSMTVSPAVAEEGEISSTAAVLVFGPKITLNVTGEYAGHRVDYRIKANNVALDRVAEGAPFWRRESYAGAPAAGIAIDAIAVEVTYLREETGRKYDFINKVSYPTYRYTKQERQVAAAQLTTDANGEAAFGQDLEDGKSYRFTFRARDSGGRIEEVERWAYGRSSSYIGSSAFSAEGVRLTDVIAQEAYRTGEAIALQIEDNGGLTPPNAAGRFLFYSAVRGIDEYAVSDSSLYRGTFRESYVPNVSFVGVWFSGERFHDTWPMQLDYAESERGLTVSIRTDRERYRPGETAEITVEVKDRSGNPREAEVNIWALDEAAFILNPEERDILAELYQGIYPSLRARSSHLAPEAASAEGGGCFAGGTKVLLAGGAWKNIEDVRVGDRVLTRESEDSDVLVPARVRRTSSHLVDGYLVVNDALRVTGDHQMFVNGEWRKAADVRVGDWLLAESGQQVRVVSLRSVQAWTRVYNFDVEGPHTYFAGGMYVHNAEKGGGATREDFEDIALYEVVRTDKDGKASVTAQLPDNVTSWRLTAQAVTKDLFAGKRVLPMPVSLPFFVDVALNRTYLVGDAPVVRLRVFGSDRLPPQIRYEIDSAGLGFEGITQTAGRSVEVPLETLATPGTHEVRFAAEGTAGQRDALVREVRVVPSYFLNRTTSFGSLDDVRERIPGDFEGRLALTFSQLERGRLYPYVQRIEWNSGLRLDQHVAEKIAERYLERYFNREGSQEQIDVQQYQVPEGGLGLLPYDDARLALSANFAALMSGEEDVLYDRTALAAYFWKTLDDRRVERDRAIVALYGLAALREPVLVTIQNALAATQDGAPEFSHWDNLNFALALEQFGAKEDARLLYEQRLRPLITSREPYAYVEALGSSDENAVYSTLLAALAAALDESEAPALERYVFENTPKDTLMNFERLLYLKAALPKLSGDPVRFSYETGRQSGEVVLERAESRELNVSASEARSIRFADIQGRVGAAVTAELPADPESLKTDPHVHIVHRTYSVDNQQKIVFEEDDLVRIEIRFDVSQDPVGGAYELVDYLPSGLRAVTQLQTVRPYGDRRLSYPIRVEDQAVTFLVGKWWKDPVVAYYARVVNKGTFTAAPPRIQSSQSPAIVNIGASETITIR